MNIMKMSCVFSILLIITFILSCNDNKQADKAEYIYLEPQENIKILLDSFLIENNKNDSIYELYIQRITPWEYDNFEPTITEITIYGGRYSLIAARRKRKPITVVKIDKIFFYVYSGLENYFSTKDNVIKNDMKEELYGNIWFVRDSANIYTDFIKSTLQAPPAPPLPANIKFVQPKGNKE